VLYYTGMRRYLVALFLALLLGTLLVSGAGASALPTQKPNYQDFSTWYIANYKLKELPFRAGALFDEATGLPLYFHQEQNPMPTASLIKLVTVGTVMRLPHDWYAKLTLTDDDNENLLRPYVGPYDRFSLLKLEAGDSITLEQALASVLIGSANNAAVALGRAIGLDRAAFIAAMRETVERWGLKHTHVDEPSGLSLANTSTAEDLALSACQVYKDFVPSFYGSSPSVTFTTGNGASHTVAHTVHDLRLHPTSFFGAKTGYLTETKYHIAAGIITPSGRHLCASLLSSPSRAESEAALNALREWADQMYQWPE
jgi:D-alanyl-D-alanine carboxypeptidase